MEQHGRREGEQREASAREVEVDNVSDGEEQEADMAHHEELTGYGQWDPATAERTVNEAERARGAFLGLAWGDVFGCPIEGWRANSIARVQPRDAKPGEGCPLSPLPLPCAGIRRLHESTLRTPRGRDMRRWQGIRS